MIERKRILVYAPWSLNGRGPGQTCVWLLSNFPSQGVQAELFAVRARIPIAAPIELHQSLRDPWRRLPWRFIAARGLRGLDQDFARELATANPSDTIAYFWPDPPVELVEMARARGIPTVREMINTACATSGPILDEAYMRQGIPPSHPISAEKIRAEVRELRAHDYFFAANSEVERSLFELGFSKDQVLRTSFGWSSQRFRNSRQPSRLPFGTRFLFVGSLNIRKGIPELLQAWDDAAVPGELILAGRTDPEVAELVGHHSKSGKVRTLGYIENVGELFAGADVFVFPSHEEGGPQVTYEAAGCGLPLITTPMGAGRLAVDGETGIVVDAGSVPQLTDAIRLLASREDLRLSYGLNARRRAQDFDYSKVAAQRCSYLLQIIENHRST